MKKADYILLVYGSETWPDKGDVIRLERNDRGMVRWICNIKPYDRTSAEELQIMLTMVWSCLV